MPELRVDIGAIAANTRVVACLLQGCGLQLVAVTKGCLGEPRVAATMLEAGAVALADTRDANLHRLRTALPDAELHRINLPLVSGAFERGDLTYVTTWEAAEAVAELRGPTRRVVLQVETGDGREGVPPDQAVELASRIAAHSRLELDGVATNYACFEGSPEGIRASVEAVAGVARQLREVGIAVQRVSGGSSSVLGLLVCGDELPAEVTELRCGEALFLGHDALRYEPIPGCRRDACLIRAEVVEEYTKHLAGGVTRRLVLAAGHQDLGAGTVTFVEPGILEIGRASDYLVVEVGSEVGRMPVGAKVEMIPGYETLVAAWMSPYVEKQYRDA